MSPIDPSPGQDHTSQTAQLPDPQREPEPWSTPRAHRNRLPPLPGALQSPRLIAFDPAVQFNRSYPPCCRTADKILFVMPQAKHYISPNFTYEKLQTPTYEDIVDVF